MANQIILKPRKDSRILSIIILVLAGLALITIAIFGFVTNNKNKQYYKTTTAIIDEIVENYEIVQDKDGTTSNTDYDVYVTYEVDGVKYEHKLYNQYDITMEEGKTITITYDERNPGRPFSASGMSIIAIIAIIFSVIVFALAIYQGVTLRKKHNLIAYLLNEGTVVTATIVEIQGIDEHIGSTH